MWLCAAWAGGGTGCEHFAPAAAGTADKIRESGDRVLGAGMTKLRQKQEEYFNLIEAKVQRLSDRCNSLASRLQMLEEGQQFTETKDDALDNPEKIHWWSRTSGGKGRGAEDVAKGP